MDFKTKLAKFQSRPEAESKTPSQRAQERAENRRFKNRLRFDQSVFWEWNWDVKNPGQDLRGSKASSRPRSPRREL